jgi:ATP/maltotriose-dependent transcriptional regulator MalT
MNSKQIAEVIQAERDRLDGLKVDVWNAERRIAELVAQKIRLDNDETDKFISDHFKIISY